MSGVPFHLIAKKLEPEDKYLSLGASFSEDFQSTIVEMVKAGGRPTDIAREFGCDIANILLWSRTDLKKVKLTRLSRKLAECIGGAPGSSKGVAQARTPHQVRNVQGSTVESRSFFGRRSGLRRFTD